ncbi:MAG: glucose-6-phosphate dehydrogenase [Thermoplasmata archaeon]|nr:glucose-6-phosphate dehydrogenase [Thermoplasmata archaeon]
MVELRSGIGPHLFVVLGATGDLMHRKLLPALFQVSADDSLRQKVVLLGVARADLDDGRFRESVHASLTAAGVGADDPRRGWADEAVHYQRLDPAHGVGFDALLARIQEVERDHQLPGDRVFYLALPVDTIADILAGLGAAGVAHGPGWCRIVIEKPFGRDLESAEELNRQLHASFQENQVFRIDHYLGKETVQNLLVFRFANMLFESIWNRDRVANVELTVAEDLGLEDRAEYYDRSGALRDMLQNHMTQLLTLVAMEAPATATGDSIRNEKVKVLQSIGPVSPDDAVFGQYVAGGSGATAVKGYLDEKGVAPGSNTETYAAAKLSINNWRWQGVPFLLRTGKRMPSKSTRIVVNFRRPPVMFFQSEDATDLAANRLMIMVQPDEGFELAFELKPPGHALTMQTHRMHFLYSEAFGPLTDAYQTLLTDIMRGDQTLFVRGDEVEAAWRVYAPLIASPPPIQPYPSGTDGPARAAELAQRNGVIWSTD